MRNLLLALLCLPILLFAQEKKLITLEDIYKKGTFRADYVPGFNSMKDGKTYTEFDAKGSLILKNFSNGNIEKILVNAADVKDVSGKQLALYDMEFSQDEQKILVFKDRESIYRRSSKAIAYAYDIATKKTTQIDTAKVLHATFSPDGKSVAYVKNNDLYIKNIATNKLIRVTKDGKWNHIINGNCDWVYEEEFEFTRAFQWSEKGTYLAYYKFDESKVPTFDMTMYESLYPIPYSYKYPKAGEANSVIEIHVFSVTSGKDVMVNIGAEKDIYIPRIQWSKDDKKLAVARLNRLQNNLEWLMADANTGNTFSLYKETDSKYVEVNNDLHFFEDGKQYLLTSEKDGIRDIYLGNIGGEAPKRLLNAPYEVTEICGIDEVKKRLFFIMAWPSTQRQFFMFDLSTGKYKMVDERPGTHSVAMNANCSYYLGTYSTIKSTPIISLNNVDSVLADSKAGRVLKNNAALNNKLTEYAMGTVEMLQVPNGKGDMLNSWILKPHNFDASKKYPVLFCNYGGPGSQQVADRWGTVNMWQQMLSQKGYIIVCVDNTGTGFKGAAFKKSTYLRLGEKEIDDQIVAAKYFGEMPYVDKNRIGHWGWSFGGFMSSLAITRGADVFKTAVAVAPVTSWRYYDNIYTERFMGLPKDNAKGYDEVNPITNAGKIKGKFLIIHGTADDNVHFQNSVMMIDEMIKKNVDFESAYYPNKNHGIRGGNTSYHIYNKMTNFILNNL